MPEKYDLVVIGCGPAGEKGAVHAAFFGKKVAVVEREPYLGGTGINTGTIPSKTLRETALYFSGLRNRGLYGIDYSIRKGLTISEFLHREKLVVEALRDRALHNLQRHGVELVWGTASFADPHLIRVVTRDGASRDLAADKILIATGSSPFHPPGIPFAEQAVYDSDEILTMPSIPKTMAVLGGGVIGCEYASIFQALDVQVTLVERADRVLGFLDAEICTRLQDRLRQLGMTFLFGEKVSQTTCSGPTSVTIKMESGREITSEAALFATGRKSNVEGLGLEKIGVALGERGLIKVDAAYRTNLDHVYAAGDVIGFPALASTSMEQARVAVCHAFGVGAKERLSPVLPYAVYTVPEIGSVGKSEDDLKKDGVEYVVGRATYDEVPRGQILGDTAGMLKLVCAKADKKLLGAQLIGEGASELVHIAANCLQNGDGAREIADAVFNYPTLAELYKVAAFRALRA